MGESTLPETQLDSRLHEDTRNSFDGTEDGDSTTCWSDTSGASDMSESDRRGDGRLCRQLERRRRKQQQRHLWAASHDRATAAH